MPPLPGFSDNPLRSRADVVRATVALLRPLLAHASPRGGRIRLPVATGAKFDEAAAQLEGYARPLWAVGALLAAAAASPTGDPELEELVRSWVAGIAAGTDPADPDYWGPMGALDQRMVEAEIVAYALLAAPGPFFAQQSEATQRNIVAWLRTMNGQPMPANNWRWFRVLANVALVRVGGVPETEVRDQVEADLQLLDSMYVAGTGWSSDGPWQTDEENEALEAELRKTPGARRDDPGRDGGRRQADYYSGSFAIQFSQLVYCRYADGLWGGAHQNRIAGYRDQARQFGATFWRYFDAAGAAVAFGRSQTYRFACAGFFAALAVADISDLPAPLDTPGAAKGFLLRHLRWWAANGDDAFYADGTMSIGWLYPNMFMCESYNSPQSVYWCMKSLIVVSLPEDHAFWQAEEADYPDMTLASYKPVQLVRAPRQILCSHPLGNHHFLLSTTQFASWPLKAAQAKYGKFAYSSAFPFAVPTGPRIEQIAPDNMLALSRDSGETWAVKWRADEPVFGTAQVQGDEGAEEEVVTAAMRWFPWADRSVEVQTTLVPPTNAWPDWHVRVHRIRINSSGGLASLHAVEGGFAGPGQKEADGLDLPALKALEDGHQLGRRTAEGYVQNDNSVLLLSYAGGTGVAMDPPVRRLGSTLPSDEAKQATRSSCSPLRIDPNTSLAFQRSLLPVAEHAFAGGLEPGTELVFVSKVFAISTAANGGCQRVADIDVKKRWMDPPTVYVKSAGMAGGPGSGGERFIRVST